MINLIGVADDGAIYAANLAQSNSLSQFVLYRWASETATQTVVFADDPGQADTNGLKRTWGDTLAVRGVGTNPQILIGSRANVLAMLTPVDSSMTTFTSKLLQTDLPPGALANGLAFGKSNTIRSRSRRQWAVVLFVF